MSTHISDIYSNEVYDNLRPLYGNWEPGQPIELGDYGVLQGRIFVRLGSIKAMNIPFKPISEPRKSQKYFASSGSTSVSLNAAGSAAVPGGANVKASLKIDFTSERAVFFNAAECEYHMIDDKRSVGDNIMKLYKASPRKWKRDWVVVTDVIKAGATTVAISGGRTSSIVIEATGSEPTINLADASVGLAMKSASNVGYQVIAGQGLTPLLGLSGIKSNFLGFGSDFRPLSMTMRNPSILQAMEISDEIQTERSPEDLTFGQLE